MNKEEKEAIEYWKRDIKLYHYNTQLASEHYAQILLNLIQKQEKIIDKMGSHIFYHQDDKFPIGYSIKEVKEYFKKEVKDG